MQTMPEAEGLQTRIYRDSSIDVRKGLGQLRDAGVVGGILAVIFLFFFYQMPSGLNLYIMASTTASVFEQYFIRKHIRERDEAAAATETVVQVTGKAPRSSRPKKPKGPMWQKR